MARRGVIEGAFGKSGKFKLYFKDGICTMENNASVIRLYLRFKRLSFDKESKRMFQ
jgi:selenocysteine-specific elongation factor